MTLKTETVELWRDNKTVRVASAKEVVTLLILGWKTRAQDGVLEGVEVTAQDTDPPYWNGHAYEGKAE